MWRRRYGLTPLFRRRGGELGDSLRIVFELKTKQATAELGQELPEEDEEAFDILSTYHLLEKG